jgi:hypothetical protein
LPEYVALAKYFVPFIVITEAEKFERLKTLDLASKAVNDKNRKELTMHHDGR